MSNIQSERVEINPISTGFLVEYSEYDQDGNYNWHKAAFTEWKAVMKWLEINAPRRMDVDHNRTTAAEVA